MFEKNLAPLLLPNLPAGGSPEHFFHFLLSYFLPLDDYLSRHKPARIVLRDCGPMNAWFEMLRPGTTREIAPLATLLEALSPTEVAQARLPSFEIDQPTRARRIARGRKRVLARVKVTSRPRQTHLTFINRLPSLPFYLEDAEIKTSGAERRSLPNFDSLLGALAEVSMAQSFAGEHLPPAEQVRVMSETSILVGQHGAGLANMVWMRPGGHVVEILPDTLAGPLRRQLFRSLAHLCGHSYACVSQSDDHAPADAETLVHAVTHRERID